MKLKLGNTNHSEGNPEEVLIVGVDPLFSDSGGRVVPSSARYLSRNETSRQSNQIVTTDSNIDANKYK